MDNNDQQKKASPFDIVKSFAEAKKKKRDLEEREPSVMREAGEGILRDSCIDWKLITPEESEEEIQLYKLTLANNQVQVFTELQLERLIYRNHPDLKDQERREVAKYMKLWISEHSTLDFTKVQPVSFADELDVVTWNRLPFPKHSLGSLTLDDVPEFKHILSLCDDAKALTLWIGSLLDSSSGRAQYLHLHGGGGNGKSTLFNAISDVLGGRHCVMARADELSQSHFGTVLEGARLLIFPDENSTSIFSSGRFKEFTGEEYTTVNPKFEKQRRIRLTHKTAVFSNNKVEITNNVADRRRLLSVSMVDDPDKNIGHRWWYMGLRSSGSAILSYCYGTYLRDLERDPSIRSYIPQADAVHKAAIHRKYEDIFDVVNEKFEVTTNEKDFLKKREVHTLITEQLKSYSSTKIIREQITQALQELGVKEATLNGIKIYRFLKERKGTVRKPTSPLVPKG